MNFNWLINGIFSVTIHKKGSCKRPFFVEYTGVEPVTFRLRT